VIRDIVAEEERLVDAEGEVVVEPEEEGEDAEGISSRTSGQTLAVVRVLNNSKCKGVNQAALQRWNLLKTPSRSRLSLEPQMNPQIEELYYLVSIRILSILTIDHRRAYWRAVKLNSSSIR
jgi:hypothetical protein